jgi:hypothetical protein
VARINTSHIFCPRCHNFDSRRWVESTYFPKYASINVIMLEVSRNATKENPHDAGNRSRFNHWKSLVKGNVYRDTSEGHILTRSLVDERQNSDKESWLRVTYGRYWQYYVGHYDRDKYKEEMIAYREGRRRSRPNDRRECKLRNSDWSFLGGRTPHAYLSPPLHET